MSTAVSSAVPAGPVLGDWAGDHLRLVLSASGGRLDLDCASGTISDPVQAGSNGKFAATGTFEQHQAGPQRADAATKPASARYSGEIQNGVMTLTIWPDGASTPNIFTLRLGATVKLRSCY